jgi:hypothetical protein
MGNFDIQLSWGDGEKLERLKEISEYLKTNYPTPVDIDEVDTDTLRMLDEAIILMLSELQKALPLQAASPLESFEAVYGVMACQGEGGCMSPWWNMLFDRFNTTKVLVDRFKAGTARDKNQLMPQMRSRGMV